MDDLCREHLMADAKEAEEIDRHINAGEIECEACGEWNPEALVELVEVNEQGGFQNVCHECLHGTGEFHKCKVCEQYFHDDLMHERTGWCERCFREEQLSPTERGVTK